MNTAKQIALERKMVIKHSMPDRCRVYPRNSGRTIVGGISQPTTPVEPRVWRTIDGEDIVDIPCRADLARAFRPDKLKQQATEVDEFNLELPFDLVFEPSDYVVINHKGEDHRFDIRKIKDMSEFDVSIECIIDQTGTVYDYD